ncbi:mitochondrial metal transporter [Dispira parvispora]|uniref:Mitochondrial metal transporter n=1 Tax=Dispira parvispora TaxID=1520584 RepID=A0A9W8E5R1_9FUNG|nr:mitochondrial metal transporter [Dispira parvispora]
MSSQKEPLSVSCGISQRSLRWFCGTPIASHAGHHHSHGEGGGADHLEEQELLLKAFTRYQDPGSRITLIGMATNIGLTVLKGVGGWLTNSVSLLADAAHSLSDLVSDFVTLFSFKWARLPRDSKYPFGYGRFEPIGALGVSFFLVTTSIGIGQHSLEVLWHLLPQLTDVAVNSPHLLAPSAGASTNDTLIDSSTLLHTHSGSNHSSGHTVDPHALWFAGISVVSKEILYQATMAVARRTNSQVLVANAWHHRSDALSSIVAVVAILGAQFGLPVLDPLGGLLVGAILLKNGIQIGSDAFKELTDYEKSTEMRKIQELVEKAVLDLASTDVTGNSTGTIDPAKGTTPLDLPGSPLLQVNPDKVVAELLSFGKLGAPIPKVRVRKMGPFYHVYVHLTLPVGLDTTCYTVSELLSAQTYLKNGIQRTVPHLQEVVIEWVPAPKVPSLQ